MSRLPLTPEVIGLVSERFKALGEPARLEILSCLREGEMTVTDIVESTGLGQANVSKHLGILHSLAFVKRRKDGLFAFYSLADKGVFQLCDLMCGRVELELKKHSRLLAG